VTLLTEISRPIYVSYLAEHSHHSCLQYTYVNNIVTYIPIASQQLGKHIPAAANVGNNRKYIARERISKHASNSTGQ
jgi:hypothetical protein